MMTTSITKISASSSKSTSISAFVSFPSIYTQSLIVQALATTLPNLALSLAPFPEDFPPQLQWADYDLLSLDIPHGNPDQYLISSYIYRKALIRKHQLHNTITEYLAKCRHREVESVLTDGIPQGWVLNLQFADELDELLMDDAFELREALEKNLNIGESGEKRWFILKPGFADRAQGIRMFSTEEELRTIFESFEPPSSDEEEDDENEEGEDDDESPNDGDGDGDGDSQDDRRESNDSLVKEFAKKAGLSDLDIRAASSERFETVDDEDEDEDEGTGVMTSQLRFFIIQEYIPRPILFDILSPPSSPTTGYKFHLRAYVLITGAYTVHLSRTMLALFSGSPYTLPTSSEEELDLRAHLTNTCLQTDPYGTPTPPAELVKQFWELKGLQALSYEPASGKYESSGTVTEEWLEESFKRVGEVIGESVKAGAECGSFGLQFIPNAFEIFGVDLLLSFSPDMTTPSNPLPPPKITLLEYNASPDFHQSGDRLRGELLEMFKGVIKISVAPFFGVDLSAVSSEGDGEGREVDEEPRAKDGEEREDMERKGGNVGDEQWGWRMVGKGEIRGSSWT